MTVNEACDYLTLSRSTLYRLVADGELRLLKVYNRSLLARSDLDAYVERLVKGSFTSSRQLGVG
ncbi:excisionase family DNA-binding protein [bacterium]|nr:excisionase family DNA-binding protein [bacterium]